jgi:hypothetical protein
MPELKELLLGLLRALQRAHRKAQPLIASPELLELEVGEDAMDVICMQFLAAGESLKRLDRMVPGLLENRYPQQTSHLLAALHVESIEPLAIQLLPAHKVVGALFVAGDAVEGEPCPPSA